jgi:hypothetical protein
MSSHVEDLAFFTGKPSVVKAAVCDDAFAVMLASFLPADEKAPAVG